jgi:molecular chaperone GrpE
MAQDNAAAADAAAGAESTEATEHPRVAELQARVAELEDRWRRALADFDNLRKRTARDAERQRLDERARVAREWLPVIDNLDLALEHAKSDPALLAGVQAVRDQALAILAALGFPRQTDVGTAFDPQRHEAVGTLADAQAPPGTVLHVVRPGYGDGERQLRPAAVVVATRAD